MAFPYVRLCPRHMRAGLQVCWYATLSKASRPQEKSGSDPVFQYVGQHKKPTYKVFVWGFSFTGALGIPTFVVPDSGRKKPRKYQLTPYRLETAEQISSAACGYGFTLIASPSKDVTKLWGMGLNKDSQLGFQRTQHDRRLRAFSTGSPQTGSQRMRNPLLPSKMSSTLQAAEVQTRAIS